jgi:UbiA prenyltransferase family
MPLVRFFKQIWSFLLYSNLWIALAAAAQVWRTIHLHQLDLRHYTTYLYTVGLGTWATYCLLRCIKIGDGSFNSSPTARTKLLVSHKNLLFFCFILASLGTFTCIIFLPRSLQVILFGIALIALTYGYNFGYHPLRQLPLLKTFLVPTVWAITVTCVPLIYDGGATLSDIICSTLERFCFILALTLPFDLRDAAPDKSLGISTLPNLLGTRYTIYLAWATLCVSALIQPLHLGIVVLYLVLALVMHHLRKPRHDFWYTGVIDGAIILEALLIY